MAETSATPRTEYGERTICLYAEIPAHLLADEHHEKQNSEKVDIATTVVQTVCWVLKFRRRLANELNRQGYEIGPTRVRFLLHELEYSLQSNQKTREGEDHPDRNDQSIFVYQRSSVVRITGHCI